jgi:hypothetical protein
MRNILIGHAKKQMNGWRLKVGVHKRHAPSLQRLQYGEAGGKAGFANPAPKGMNGDDCTHGFFILFNEKTACR